MGQNLLDLGTGMSCLCLCKVFKFIIRIVCTMQLYNSSIVARICCRVLIGELKREKDAIDEMMRSWYSHTICAPIQLLLALIVLLM